MTPPSFFDMGDLEEYLDQVARLIADECAAGIDISPQQLILARVVPGLTQEQWELLARRHDLHDWHVLPLPAQTAPKKRAPSIMVQADEKKFLFSGSF